MWTRAVWTEPEGEQEGVIPDLWVMDNYVHWPPGANAAKAMEQKKKPSGTWRKFKLVKIKITSGKDYVVQNSLELEMYL